VAIRFGNLRRSPPPILLIEEAQVHSTRCSLAVVVPAIVLVALAAGCDSTTALEPSTDTGRHADWARGGGLGEAALIVGNLSFGPTDAILRYDGSGSFIDAMVPVGTAGLRGPCCMTYGPDENLYVSSPGTGQVLRFHGITGAFIDEFVTAHSGGVVLPLFLVFREGRLYVGDAVAGAIRMYDATTGASLGDFVPPGDHGMIPFDPQDFKFGPDGQLYVASEATGRILRYDGVTGAFIDEVVPAGPDGISAAGFAFGPDGHLYAAGSVTNEVRRYDVRTKRLIDIFVPAGSGGMHRPVGTVFGPDGNLYIASADSHEILRYDGVTGSFIDAFVPAGSGGLSGGRVIQFKETMTLCHASGRNEKTLTVGYVSAFDHVAHGDALGRCG
jgi:streptogramin lyase